LRAAFHEQLFGVGDPASIVDQYQDESGGLAIFRHVLIAGTHGGLATWLTNLIGLLGGFGWEGVSALIVVSGFSLTIAQRSKILTPRGWAVWYGKRAKRILLPFYLAAAPFLALYAAAVAILPHLHQHFAATLDAKLHAQFHTPLLGIVMSHTVLFDPWNRFWSADFFAPAWWFVPAILLAYAIFPVVHAARNVARGIPLLVVAACVTILAYAASNAGILLNETWYYIVLHELFNFCLGVVVGTIWVGPGRAALERVLDDPFVAFLACGLFVLGNIVDWMPEIRPIASMLYGPSLVVVVVFLARRIAHRKLARALVSVDSYDLYLVHQPFAFPIALVAASLFHAYAVFVGWFVFLGVAVLAAKLLTAVQKPFLRR
jgi:hypothetical protein